MITFKIILEALLLVGIVVWAGFEHIICADTAEAMKGQRADAWWYTIGAAILIMILYFIGAFDLLINAIW